KDQNGHRCTSQKFLQIDHIHNWSQGGTHDLENLQVLCGVHNRLKYEREIKS
ncbi:HNH endonuclease, partial [bacterium]|nr:HNH endonuclease [bacterium]